MRCASSRSIFIAAATLGAALAANGLASAHLPTAGAGVCLLGALLLLRPKRKAPGSDRSAVRLALRLAAVGESTMLVEHGGRMRVVRADAAPRPGLQYVGALQKGVLILARER